MNKRPPTKDQQWYIQVGDGMEKGFYFGPVEQVEYVDENALYPIGARLKWGYAWSPYDGFDEVQALNVQSMEHQMADYGDDYDEFREFYPTKQIPQRMAIEELFS